jgi:acetate kinase
VPVLVVNAGSSSLKLSLLNDDDSVLHAVNEPLPAGGDPAPLLSRFLSELVEHPDVAGHRVVHGGSRFVQPVVIDASVLSALDELASLAPLHNPPAIEGITALKRVAPDLEAVACFDTAFHASLSPAAYTYAVPAGWNVRRYGFHGLSHRYASRRAASLLGEAVESVRLVTCHLGAGASLCAVDHGRSVDTTMGFTPLEGLVMATRSGTVDPGAVLSVQQRLGLSAAAAEDVLNHQSGVLALAGTADMREVVALGGLALDVYVHRLRKEIAAMVGAMGSIDGLVFTGGVGERSPGVRRLAAGGLGFLGVAIDPEINYAVADDDVEISTGDAAVRTVVVHAREDVEIAAAARQFLPRQRR